jgi:hypothetical protein
VADVFKFRSRVGADVAREALRELLRRRIGSPADVDQMARVCRVQGVVRPYLKVWA